MDPQHGELRRTSSSSSSSRSSTDVQSGIPMAVISTTKSIENMDRKADFGRVESDPAESKAKDDVKLISNFETMLHLLKGNIGTGIFAMPGAFRNSGIWVGSVLLPVMAIICTHCMQMLVRSAAVMKSREGDFSISYADVAEAACRTGPKKLAKFGKASRIIINVFICLTQFGFCCVYLVFTSTNLKQVVDYYAPELQWKVQIYMCLLAIPLIFLNWIRNLKWLAPVSFISNLLQFSSIIVVFYYIFRDGLPSVSDRPAFASWGGLPLFFGTTVFTFEGIALVLPLQKDMRRPDDFKGWTGILNVGMAIVTIIYIYMGFYGFLKYGDCIEASITLNLPQEDVLAQVVKLFLVVAICGNYAMQFYVPIPIMWPSLSKWSSRFISNDLIGELLFRTIMVLVTLVLSSAIPRIDLVISLVGAFGSSFLALIFPPLLELATYWPKVSKITITKDILILVFGAIGFATGTYAAIRDVILAFSGSEGGSEPVCSDAGFLEL